MIYSVSQPLSDDDSDASSIDSDEEALDYEAQLEEQLEDAYQQYLHRKGEPVGCYVYCISPTLLCQHSCTVQPKGAYQQYHYRKAEGYLPREGRSIG